MILASGKASLVPGVFQNSSQGTEKAGVVIHDENPSHHASLLDSVE